VARLRVLANPARLRIVLRPLEGEQSVGQLETELDLKQPHLSQYLGELRDAGLVVTRRESRTIFYRLADGARGRGWRSAATIGFSRNSFFSLWRIRRRSAAVCTSVSDPARIV